MMNECDDGFARMLSKKTGSCCRSVRLVDSKRDPACKFLWVLGTIEVLRMSSSCLKVTVYTVQK